MSIVFSARALPGKGKARLRGESARLAPETPGSVYRRYRERAKKYLTSGEEV
jgi:hypothetical protein